MHKPKKILLYFILLFVIGVCIVAVFVNLALNGEGHKPKEPIESTE